MRRSSNHNLLLHQDENTKLYHQLAEALLERFQPQDAFETEFLRMLLSALWQRSRFEYLDYWMWASAIHHSGQEGAAHLAASTQLENLTLLRSRHFGMAQDRNSQAFHRTLRSWTQCVAKQKTQKTNEPK